MLILGDICPTKDNIELFKNGDAKALFGDVLPLIDNADVALANLECALADNPKPIQKAGPVLHAPTATAATLKKAGIGVLSLANNHIRDCGDEGVKSTLKACSESGIKTVGAGENIIAAKQPLMLGLDGKKVAVVSFAEHEFNFATKERAGAATLDIYEDFDRLRSLRQQVDVLIVFYHGGIEYHPYPSPLLAKKCRKMADCGADLVLCQHSHCIGTVEHRGDSTIVYGQGNSVFGYRDGDDGWNRGMIVELDLSGEKPSSQCHFIEAALNGGIQLMTETKAESWRQTLQERERNVASDEFIEEQWQQFCVRIAPLDLPLLLGWRRLPIALNRRLGNSLVKLLYSRRRANVTHNLIRCEAHHEVVSTILRQNDYN